MPLYTPEEYEKIQKAKVKQLTEVVNNQISAFTNTDSFKDYLKFMSHMKSYSVDNQLLIFGQNPNAKHVAGLKAWNSLERRVNKGEKSMHIFAPIFKKKVLLDEKTNQPILNDKGEQKTIEKLVGFKPVPVFDVSQTHGKELVTAHDLVKNTFENDTQAEDLYARLSQYLKENTSLKIMEESFGEDNQARGFFRPSDNTIAINTDEPSGIAKLKTLIHEYAHSEMHYEGSQMQHLPRGHKEAHAESVAFAVMTHLGFDTADYSAPYIATWAKDPNLMKQAIREIQSSLEKTLIIVDKIQNPAFELKLETALKNATPFDIEQRTISHEEMKELFPNMRFVLNNEMAKQKHPYIHISYFDNNKYDARIEIGKYNVETKQFLDLDDEPVLKSTIKANRIIPLNVLYHSQSFAKAYEPFAKQFALNQYGDGSIGIVHNKTKVEVDIFDNLPSAKTAFLSYAVVENSQVKSLINDRPELAQFEKVIQDNDKQLSIVQTNGKVKTLSSDQMLENPSIASEVAEPKAQQIQAQERSMEM